MKQALRAGAILLTVQLALVIAYCLVERGRSENREALGTGPPQLVELAMPTLSLRRADGTVMQMRSSQRPTLVHIWATWCPPCRQELPALLSLPSSRGVDVVAVALDEDWSEVERFLGGRSASNVVLGNALEAERLLGVSNLPVTFLVRAGTNTAVTRFDGARDWGDESFVRAYLSGH